MQANRATGTASEILLSKALWAKGYRYRKNDKTVIGKPDIVFKTLRIAIFCDGEFWHGKHWKEKRNKISINRACWINKIERNIDRDKNINEQLSMQGWTVMRFWHKDIKGNLQNCLSKIENVLTKKYKLNG